MPSAIVAIQRLALGFGTVGIIGYIDGAATGQFVDLKVEAFKFSLTCLTKEARLKDYAWRTLGYVPTYRKESSP